MPQTLPSWTAHLPQWIPWSLSDLHGPREGVVDLPLDLCWSGRTRYDVGRFRQRVALYNLVIVQGLQEHYPRFLDPQHLIDAWPLLRRRLGEGYVEAWENRFVELAGRGASREAFAAARAKWQAATWA
ncbi:hypothetical protein NE235_28110 [Actinoallomurus spadix]|uniref:Uncharacterized protein n=1 Tax=Actinoallomurus spadix TaxID=79912 RepID=A0ABN0VRA9_9ACTN|nr:hypothetical protein [Actinoallomurus spadix]MCO5989984.1 hypothetical protein [Actinoallomurus spadix]